MDGHFSDLIHIFKNRQKSDSFAAHFEHHFKSTTSRKFLCKCMTFKVVYQINTVGEMKNVYKLTASYAVTQY